MKIGYAVLYTNGDLVISKNHTILSKSVYKDYGEFEDTDVPWKNDNKKIKQVRILNQIKSNHMCSWFEYCYNLTTLIDFQNLDVSDCEDFAFTFYGCKLLTDITTLVNWNVSNGTDFSRMFFNCVSLQNLNELWNWNVSNGTDFLRMFSSCKSLQKISLPNSIPHLDCKMFGCCNPNLKIHWKKHIYTYEDLLSYGKIY